MKGPLQLACWLALGILATPCLAEEKLTPAQEARRTPIVDVVRRTRDAVVNISATQVYETTVGVSIWDEFFGLPRRRPQTRRYERTSIGSGFVIHPEGYIVTNAHVVSQAAKLKAIFADKTEFEAEQVGIDERHDLAVLKINADRPLPALTLGRSDDLMIGETVIAIGNPLGYQHTVTSGIISALDREVPLNEDITYRHLIQTDASINRGNSGGPLLNIAGELIGINTAVRGDAQNIGFAIPVDALRKLLPQILSIEHGPKRLEVGIRLSWRQKLRVVEAHGPAAEAGIEAGDELVSVDGRPLKSDLDFYIYLLHLRPDDRLVVETRRDGKLQKHTIRPRPVPIPDGARLMREKFGLVVRLLTPAEARQLDIRGGLIVTSVEPNSPAARAGFERGMVVFQVGQFFPTDLDQLGLLLENVAPGDKLMFRLLRITRDYLQAYAVQLTAR